MVIGVPRERKDQERRVAMIPDGVRELSRQGHRVLVEAGAGAGAGFPDGQYGAVGATLVKTAEAVWAEAELVVKVKEPLADEWPRLRSDQLLFTYLHLASDPALADALLERKVTAIAYETVETPPGNYPLLAPMSEIAGRLAPQVGARLLEAPAGGPGILIGGTAWVPGAAVLVIGGGVVGRSAARVAAGMGARVTVIDKNPQKLLALDEHFQGRVELALASPDVVVRSVANADLLIGAVMVVGARAPVVVSRPMVASMQPGRVIVDVAIDQGGCVETSRPTTHTDPVYQAEGVWHYCVTNMPGAVPRTATQALAAVTLPLVAELAAKGAVRAFHDNPGLAAGVNTAGGHVIHPAVAASLGRAAVPLSHVIGRAAPS